MSKANFGTCVVLSMLAAIMIMPAGTAQATSSETAEKLCKSEMETNRGALALRDMKVRRHEDVPYVYGNADFDDIKNVHFRCKVRRDQLQEVTYLVPDPEYTNGRMWVTKRPQGTAHESLVLDEPAMSAPPLVSDGPHFIRVPQSN